MTVKILKRIIICTSFILMTLVFINVVEAATLKISTSKSKVEPGESFKVTVSVSNGAGYVSANVSNGSGGFGSTWLENSSKTFTCKAGKSGSVTIRTSGTVADFSTEKDESVSRSKSVKIEEKKETTTTAKSKKIDTKTKKENETKNEETKVEKTKEKEEERYLLESLEIENEEITPRFNSEIFEYEVKIKGKEHLNIVTKTNRNDIIVEILGNENLKLGENIITINLRGQDDKQRTTYKIKVFREKSELEIANEKIKRLKITSITLLITTILFIITTIGLSIMYIRKH